MFDYDFPPGIITLECVSNLMDLYYKGGKLSFHSIQKLLKLTYRSLKKHPTVSFIDLKPKDRLTVVGDLHGMSISTNN